MSSVIKLDFVSLFNIPVFALDGELTFSEINTPFSGLFGDVLGQHIGVFSDEFNQRKFERKTSSGQTYRFKASAADKRNTPYSIDLRRHEDQYIGFAVEAADAAKAEAMLASYSEMMEKQNRILKAEKNKSEKLLHGLLPAKTITELYTLSGETPKFCENTGLLMIALPDVPAQSERLVVEPFFAELNELVTCFDLLAETYDCQKLSATGEVYLVATAPQESSPCEILANFAADIVKLITLRESEIHLPCKIGLHIGEVMSGVVGKTQLSFNVFGKGINAVTEIANQAEPMQINCSEAIYQQGSSLRSFLHQIKAETNTAMRYRLDAEFMNNDADQLQEIMNRAKALRRSFQ